MVSYIPTGQFVRIIGRDNMTTKDTITRNAFELFVERGFKDVSVNDIIEKTNITKGGFYHHFKSKDDLIKEVCERYIHPFFSVSVSNTKQALNSGDTFENLCIVFYKNIYMSIPPDQIKEDFEGISMRDFYFLIFEGARKFDFMFEMRKKFNDEREELLEELLEKGKKDGVLKQDLDSKQWANTINAVSDGIVSLKLLDSDINTEEKSITAFRQILLNIKA